MSHLSIDVIQAEHRSIGVVLNGLLYFANSLREQSARPDYALFRSMLHYIDVFPGRFHHPKEDRFLFAKLRLRTREADPVLQRLEDEHAQGDQKMRWLMHAVLLLEKGGDGYVDDFVAKVKTFTQFHYDHVSLEEQSIIPLARKVLTDEDWREIDAAFASALDPQHGDDTRREFDRLYAKIVKLLPPLGPHRLINGL